MKYSNGVYINDIILIYIKKTVLFPVIFLSIIYTLTNYIQVVNQKMDYRINVVGL